MADGRSNRAAFKQSIDRTTLDRAPVYRKGNAYRGDGPFDVEIGVSRRGDERLGQHAVAKQLLQEQRAVGLRGALLGIPGDKGQA